MFRVRHRDRRKGQEMSVLRVSLLAVSLAVLGVFAGPAYCQQADDGLGAAIWGFGNRSVVDANTGNRVTEVMLYGNFGNMTLQLGEKETRALMGDPNAGLSMKWDSALMAKYYSVQIQKTFGATDDEWKVLAPKLGKVQKLSGQLASHGRSGRGKGDAMTNFEKAWGALSASLKNKNAKLEDIKKLLQVVHDEEAKTRAELQQAQKDLREVLTLRQEALLVQMGLLE